jgi:hypothetical protein
VNRLENALATLLASMARHRQAAALSRDDRTRPQDAIDLRALARVATQAELTRAREALRLIEQRGFARGRDLGAALAVWLQGSND